MEILNKTSKITAMLLICHSLSYAGWKTVADSQVAIQTSNPVSLKTSLTNSFSGGGARVQWRNLGTLNMINATSPKFAVGCNGIEIGFGSISFLDFDNLVNKLKMIASQAPAFAFKMAIDTACSQCSTIMQDLEEAVEAINNFSLDSCGIAENLGNSVGSSLANASDSRYADSYAAQKAANEDKSTFNTNKIKDTINSWSDTVNGKSLKLDKLKGYGSFLNNLRIHKIPSLNGYDPKEFIELLRTLVGDVVGYIDEDNENQDTYTYIYPDGNINDLIALFVGKKSPGEFKRTIVTLTGNNGDWDEISLSNLPKGFSVSTNTSNNIKFDDSSETGNSNTRSWRYNIKNSLETVISKIKTNTALTSTDYVYLQNLPYNGYKIVNYFATTSTTSGAITLDEYAEYIAIENAKFQMGLLLDLARSSLAEYMNELKKNSSNGNEKMVEKYQMVMDAIIAQKSIFARDENILSIPRYIEKIEKLQADSIPKNRIERLQ